MLKFIRPCVIILIVIMLNVVKFSVYRCIPRMLNTVLLGGIMLKVIRSLW
jgi:hypothetical protein